MDKKENNKLEEEFNKIQQEISDKQKEIMDSDRYREINKSILELRMSKEGDDIKYKDLKNKAHKKYANYGGGYYWRGIKLNDVKSSVKQGIKIGLGVKSLKEIEYHIIKIVKELIAKDLKSPHIEILRKNILNVNNKIEGLEGNRNKLVKDGTSVLSRKQEKLYEKLNKKDISKDKELEKKIEEADEKVKNLPKHLPKIIREVNKRLILDGIED